MTKAKIKQNMTSWIATISMLLIFGAVGSMQLDRISIVGGLVRIAIYFVIFLYSLSNRIELDD